MFKIEEQKSLQWPVTVSIPKNGGKTSKSTFTAEFELISQDEFSAIYKEESGTDEDLLRRVVIGFEGVTDANDKTISFSDESRDRLIKIPYVRSALVSAYLECSIGKAAVRKN